MAMKKRQFSWQPTLIEDWGLEPADEAKPLDVDEGVQTSEFKLPRKKKLSHQFAVDEFETAAPESESQQKKRQENFFVFTGSLDESELEVGRTAEHCSTPSPADVNWPPAPARWSDSSPQGPTAPPNSATSSFDNSADLFPSSQESESYEESVSSALFGITDVSTPESASTSDDVFDSSIQKKSPSHSPSF